MTCEFFKYDMLCQILHMGVMGAPEPSRSNSEDDGTGFHLHPPVVEHVPRHLVLHHHQAGRPAGRHLNIDHLENCLSRWANVIGSHPKRGHGLTAKELSDGGAEHCATISKPEQWHQTIVKVF